MNPLLPEFEGMELEADDEPPDRLVWVSDGARTYLTRVPAYILQFGEEEGVCELDGRVVHWSAVTEL